MHARIRRAALLVGVAVTLALALEGTASAQATGTWKVNVAKSQYKQGQALKSSTLVYEPAGAGVKVTVDQVMADGTKAHYAYATTYDGKDVAVVGNPNADMAARTRVDANTTKLVYKKGGKIMSTLTLVTSADGKTLTITTVGSNAKGEDIGSVAVYEKQV
ncbi:MAG: hypothetical protein ABIS06_20305 [Vicinamibacterales bacterium]